MPKILLPLAFVFLTLVSNSAWGAENEPLKLRITISTLNLSHHFKERGGDKDYNEVHSGLFISINNFIIGQYTNSYDQQSNVIGYGRMFSKRWGWSVLLADGYEGHSNNGYNGGPFLVWHPIKYVTISINPAVVGFGFRLPILE